MAQREEQNIMRYQNMDIKRFFCFSLGAFFVLIFWSGCSFSNMINTNSIRDASLYYSAKHEKEKEFQFLIGKSKDVIRDAVGKPKEILFASADYRMPNYSDELWVYEVEKKYDKKEYVETFYLYFKEEALSIVQYVNTRLKSN